MRDSGSSMGTADLVQGWWCGDGGSGMVLASDGRKKRIGGRGRVRDLEEQQKKLIEKGRLFRALHWRR